MPSGPGRRKGSRLQRQNTLQKVHASTALIPRIKADGLITHRPGHGKHVIRTRPPPGDRLVFGVLEIANTKRQAGETPNAKRKDKAYNRMQAFKKSTNGDKFGLEGEKYRSRAHFFRCSPLNYRPRAIFFGLRAIILRSRVKTFGPQAKKARWRSIFDWSRAKKEGQRPKMERLRSEKCMC